MNAQQLLLATLIQKCASVIYAAGKVQTQGWNVRLTAILFEEISDLSNAVQCLGNDPEVQHALRQVNRAITGGQ